VDYRMVYNIATPSQVTCNWRYSKTRNGGQKA